MDTFRTILAVGLVVGIAPALTWWFLVHPFARFWRKVGARGTMTVMGLLLAAGLVGLFLIRDRLLGRDLGLQWPLVALGVVLITAAVFISRKRRKYLTMRILIGIPEVETDADKRGKLLAEGPYALIRHPRYVEFTLGVFGYAAIANYVGSWIAAILTIPVLRLVVMLEERELADRFGEEYEAYAARVPRFIPKKRSD